MYPSALERNLTPTSTAWLSLSAGVAGAAEASQSEYCSEAAEALGTGPRRRASCQSSARARPRRKALRPSSARLRRADIDRMGTRTLSVVLFVAGSGSGVAEPRHEKAVIGAGSNRGVPVAGRNSVHRGRTRPSDLRTSRRGSNGPVGFD